MAALWLAPKPLLLASTSHARRSLIAGAGLPLDVQAAGVDERAIERSMGDDAPPAAIAERLAGEKAAAVAERNPDRVVIGADQVLDLGGRAMAKPADPAEAGRQLAALSGRTHRLSSAVAVKVPGHGTVVFVEHAHLTMRHLDAPAIAAYLERVGEAACWSAGGYQVESLGIHLFDRIEGEHSTILGLPLLPLLATLRRFGLIGD
jgi:septum formation protein